MYTWLMALTMEVVDWWCVAVCLCGLYVISVCAGLGVGTGASEISQRSL